MSTTTRAAGWRSSLLAALGLLLGTSIACVAPAAAADSPPLILEHLTTADGLPAGHRVRHPAGLAGLRVARHRGWPGSLRRPRAAALCLLPGARNGLPETTFTRSSRTRITICGSPSRMPASPVGIGRPIRSPCIATTLRMPARSPAMPRARSFWIRTAASGSARLDAGIDILDPATGRFEHLRHDPAAAGVARERSHSDPRAGRSGTLWVGTDQRTGSLGPRTAFLCAFPARGGRRMPRAAPHP